MESGRRLDRSAPYACPTCCRRFGVLDRNCHGLSPSYCGTGDRPCAPTAREPFPDAREALRGRYGPVVRGRVTDIARPHRRSASSTPSPTALAAAASPECIERRAFRASGVRDLGDVPPPASADTSAMSRSRHLMSQPAGGTSANASSLRASSARCRRFAKRKSELVRSAPGSSCGREAGPRRPLLRATGRLRDRDGWSGPWFATGPGRDGLRRATVPA